jgi:hypothetical protein
MFDVSGSAEVFGEPSAGDTDPNGASEVNTINFRSRSVWRRLPRIVTSSTLVQLSALASPRP